MTKHTVKAFQVNDKFDDVIDLDFSGITSVENGGKVFHGTISIETKSGWKNFSGEHGLNDYAEEYGFSLDVEIDD